MENTLQMAYPTMPHSVYQGYSRYSTIINTLGKECVLYFINHMLCIAGGSEQRDRRRHIVATVHIKWTSTPLSLLHKVRLPMKPTLHTWTVVFVRYLTVFL